SSDLFVRYMLLIYLDEQALSQTEREQCYRESTQLAHELDAAGQYVAAAPLEPTATATSVRVRQGKRVVTDGPFAETKEQLGGYFLVDGAFCSRSFGPMPKLAPRLARDFTVFMYDRRGRGDSGDTAPYAVEREIEDLDALIREAGGSAFVFAISSGAALALEAAASR